VPKSPDAPLGISRNVVVVLRLLLDEQGALIHGEVVDASGVTCRRFTAWGELAPSAWEQVIAQILARTRDDPDSGLTQD
jgi:hypothetical protein